MPQRYPTSKKVLGAERIIVLVGAADKIAPFDHAAFEKKTGELIGRSATARKRAKGRGLRSGGLVSLPKRKNGRVN
jgi:hypothetical protein